MDPTDRAIKGFYCTSEWSPMLLPKVHLILEIWLYGGLNENVHIQSNPTEVYALVDNCAI